MLPQFLALSQWGATIYDIMLKLGEKHRRPGA